jgi:ribosomal protein S18 acetylase RimI-like enzyme
MIPEAVFLRVANPTHDEGLAFARYVDVASEGGFRYAFGRRFADIIATAFVLPGHDLSFEFTVFAECDGVIVGMASGYTAEQHGRSSDLPLRQAPGNRVFRVFSLALLRTFLRIRGGHAEGDFYLNFLAVDGEHRGQGVGSSLLEFMEKRAVAGGSTRFTLDVSAKNDRAERLYVRRGLTVESVAPKSSFLPTFVHRMVKDL